MLINTIIYIYILFSDEFSMYNIISQKIRSSVVRFLKVGGSFFSAVVGAGVGYLYLDQNVAGIRCVQGPSMAPTLNATEYTEEKFKENELGLSYDSFTT